MIDFLLSRSRPLASPVLGTMPVLGSNAESGNMGKWMMRRIVTKTGDETIKNMDSRMDAY